MNPSTENLKNRFFNTELPTLWKNFLNPVFRNERDYVFARLRVNALIFEGFVHTDIEAAKDCRFLIDILQSIIDIEKNENERTLQTNENIQPVKTTDQSNKAVQPLSKEDPKTGLISAIQEYTDRFTTTYLKSLSIPALADFLANQINKKQIQDEIKAFEKEQGRQPQKKTNSRFGGPSALSHPNYTVQDIEHIEIHGV